MEVEEVKTSDTKTDKAETKLNFSIDSLLADKFDKCVNEQNQICGAVRNNETTGDTDFFNDRCGRQSDELEDDDKASSSSEQVDVESSNAGDSHDFVDVKSPDYQQPGKSTVLK